MIAPGHYFATVGADSLRLFRLFVGPPTDDFAWSAQSDQMMECCHRFLGRVWRLATRGVGRRRADSATGSAVGALNGTRSLERFVA